MKALQSLVQRVAATIERYRMLAPGQKVGVAVSGGADSVCLLQVLLELAPRWTLCLAVLHLDHQLRGDESRADAEFVREMAGRLGLAIVSRQVSLATSGNLEQNGRQARLEFYRQTIATGMVERVAVGHTRSDQAETVLFRLLRGSGTAGLAGVRPVTPDGVVRPLIGVGRAEVEDYLKARGIAWREDSTNAGVRFARNRIRHDLLPQLVRDWNPEIASALARTAELAAADEDYWRVEIDRIAAGCLTVDNGAVVLPVSVVAGLPVAAAGRLVRRAIELAKGDLLGVDFRHIDDALRLAGSTTGNGRLQVPGLEIRRSLEWVRFGARVAGSYRTPADAPGAIPIPGTNRAICLELIEKAETFGPSECVYNDGMGFVDWGRVSGSLELRSWMPGDRYQPVGGSGIKKLKTLFQIARIPSWERVRWPVLVDGNAIVWTRRFGPAADYAAGPRSQAVLRIREMESA